jgi:hypothetical protein
VQPVSTDSPDRFDGPCWFPREQDERPNDGNQPEPRVLAHPMPMLCGRMIVIETFERGRAPRASSLGEIRIDTGVVTLLKV